MKRDAVSALAGASDNSSEMRATRARVSLPWRERSFQSMQAASEIAGVSTGSLYRLAAGGQLVLKRIAGRTLVETESLVSLLGKAQDWTPSDRPAKARAVRTALSRQSKLEGA